MRGELPLLLLLSLALLFCRFVGKFISRKDRMKEMGHNQRFTNVYIKNFGEEFNDDQLIEAFQVYGKIVSAKVRLQRSSSPSGPV